MGETCARCGRVADPARDGNPPLAWSAEPGETRTRWTCPACTREHVRSIEAKFNHAWW